MLDNVSKAVFGFAARNAWLNQAAKKWGLRFGAAQVVAGNTIEQAIAKVIELNAQGLQVTLNHLGEYEKRREEAVASTQQNIAILGAIAAVGGQSSLSLKLTQVGLDIDPAFCLDNVLKVVAAAKKHQLALTIDMEDSSHCQPTLDIVGRARAEYDQVGTVIQAYLHRAADDVAALVGAPLRLVKGAYQEAPDIAYQDKVQIDANLRKLIAQHLISGSYTAIASHDQEIITYTRSFTKENNIPPQQFEFQFLYGFRTELQLSLVQQGYTVRVYVPFGSDWFGYFMRRLAERPQNVAFALKGFFGK